MAQIDSRTPEQRLADDNIRRNENAEALIGSPEDIVTQPETVSPNQNQSAEEDPADSGLTRRETIQRSPQDDIRNQISARFRRAEPDNERPFNNDMSDPENIYGEVAAEPSDAELDAQAAAAEQQPPPPVADDVDRGDPNRMISRIVRGQKVTLSEQEWLDRAAQVTAADSYLAEAREYLKGAKQTRDRGTDPDRQHPDGETGAEPTESPPPEPEVQHPELTARDVVRKIQYEDPEEAAAELERLIDARAGKMATEGQLQRSAAQDLQRSQKALAEFSAKYPDIAKDENANVVMEKNLYALYREDMLKIGLRADQLPRSTSDLANWHRHYRMQGYEVRNTPELLEAARERYEQWRDPSQPTVTPARRAAPSVQVNVKREERRMAIPNQPTRAAVPRRDVQIPSTQTRSEVVANMRRARGQL